jgi:HAD superfamily hydrolase (TIGR01509 family)
VHAILDRVNERDGRGLALIFDLDGVLVHSMPLHTLAWERYLEKLNIRVPDLERRMHGKRNPELVRDLIDSTLPEDLVLEHGAAKERLFREMLVASGAGQYWVPGLLEFLQRHQELPKAVGSNAEPANIDFVLDRFNLRPFFQVVVNGMQVQRPKPFPDIYLIAAEQLGVPPGNCVVFEDSPTGVEAARAAGMRIVGVETTPTHFHGLDLRIRDFLDPRLEPWLALQRPI